MSDEHLYKKVLDELKASGPDEVLLAKAFAESNGNATEARARYLRLRVTQLQAAGKPASNVSNISATMLSFEAIRPIFWPVVAVIAISAILAAAEALPIGH